MTKIPRTHIEGAIYYVTARGDNEEKIFLDAPDYEAYLGLLRKYKEQYGFKLFAYCLLPTHLHLLIELKEGLTISDILHDLNANYTKYFNAKYSRKGHLFEERHKIVLVEKNQYMLAVSGYIHLNPLKLGLVKAVGDYSYSSYLYYAGRRQEDFKKSVEIDSEVKELALYLNQGKDYTGYLAQDGAQDIENLGKVLNKETILGSKEFAEKIEAYVTGNHEKEKDQSAEKPKHSYVLVCISIMVVLGLVSAFLYLQSVGLRDKFNKAVQIKEQEINKQAAQEKKKIYQDLDEKYRADQVSYQAMSKRLQIEKNRVKELEGKAEK